MSDFFSKLLMTLVASTGLVSVMIWIGAKYLAKLIAPLVAKYPAAAQDIATIADAMTDEICASPVGQSTQIDDWLNELVDKLIKELGLKPSTAKRVALAAIWKHPNAPNPKGFETKTV